MPLPDLLDALEEREHRGCHFDRLLYVQRVAGAFPFQQLGTRDRCD